MTRRTTTLLSLFAALLLGACDAQVPPTRVATRLEIVSGDAQSGEAGASLPQPLVVRPYDRHGPIYGQAITFTVVSGGGTITSGTVLTNSDGLAEARWTLGTSTADSQRVEVSAVDYFTGKPQASATARATARPGPAAALAVVGSSVREGSPGAAVDSLVVRVVDRFGNPVPGASVAWTVKSGGGRVSPAAAETDAEGIAKALWTLGPQVDAAQLAEAAAASLAPVSFSARAAPPAAGAAEAAATTAGSLANHARLQGQVCSLGEARHRGRSASGPAVLRGSCHGEDAHGGAGADDVL